MDKIIQWVTCNQDWITPAIAVFGAVLSAWNWLERHLENRKRVVIEVKNVFCFGPEAKTGGYTEVLHLYIINKSREPITLSQLQMSCDAQINRFGEYRMELHSQSNKKGSVEVIRRRWFSDTFPVKLEGWGMCICYLRQPEMYAASSRERNASCESIAIKEKSAKKLPALFLNGICCHYVKSQVSQ